MPADRFFISPLTEGQDRVELTGAEQHHLVHVMRLKEGEEAALIDGEGALASAVVEELGRRHALLRITHFIREKKPPFPRVVIQAIPRMAALEFIVEKGTELGMSALWLFPGVRSDRSTLSENQLERLRHIAIAAIKQCGRLHLPELLVIPPIAQWDPIELPLFFGDLDKEATPFLHACQSTAAAKGGIAFAVGPESGFTHEERTLLLQAGALGVALHRNVLRAETASLAALSIIEQLSLIAP